VAKNEKNWTAADRRKVLFFKVSNFEAQGLRVTHVSRVLVPWYLLMD
jgi:hypothetical protein